MTSMLRGKSAAAKSGSPGKSTGPAVNVPIASGAARRGPAAKVKSGSPAAPAGPAAAAPAGAAVAESAEDRAVRSGYELCEAAIRRGQDAARRLAPGVAEMTSGLKEVPGAREALGLAEGAFRAWSDLATAWMRAVLPLAPAGFPDPLHILETLREAVAKGAGAQAAGAAGASAGRGHGVSFAVTVASARPARIGFELSREADPATLAVQPLQPLSREAGGLAILGVELAASKDRRNIEVHLTISDSQPPGRYLGAVYDKGSGAFVGGLTVDLSG